MNNLPRFLATVIENGIVVEQASSDDFLLAIICLVIGAFNLFFPYGAWYLGYGWKFRDAEPSDLMLTMTRIGGILIVIIGFILFVI